MIDLPLYKQKNRQSKGDKQASTRKLETSIQQIKAKIEQLDAKEKVKIVGNKIKDFLNIL